MQGCRFSNNLPAYLFRSIPRFYKLARPHIPIRLHVDKIKPGPQFPQRDGHALLARSTLLQYKVAPCIEYPNGFEGRWGLNLKLI